MIVLHAAINKGSGLTMGLVPGLEDTFNVQLYGAIALALAFVAVAFVLVAATRGRLGYRAQTAPLEAPSRS